MGYSPLLASDKPGVSESEPPELILITSTRLLGGDALLQCIEQSLQGGVDCILMRERQMDSAHALALAASLRELTQSYQARLIIHSFADIAQAVGADGVHLPSHQIQQAPQLRQWLNQENMSISVSCHHAEDLQQAGKVSASFALLSPVFETRSHPGEPALGINAFEQLALASPVPVVALGGIDTGNRHQLSHYGVAVISALLTSDDPAASACSLCRCR